jgi:tagatose 1,6-diphosphate aldolase
MRPLSLGKIRSLQQLTNELGVFTMIALDHRGTFLQMLSKTMGEAYVTWENVVAEKIRIARTMAPHASAVLLDPLYSAGPVIASGVLPNHTAFAVACEKSGYSGQRTSRLTILEADWSVEAIKRLGASAVKLLLPYHPDSPVAEQQEELVRQVAAACNLYEIAFLLEPICYPLDQDQVKTDAAFAAQRPEIVIESARRLVPLGIDVLKSEFPTDANYETDTSKMYDYCRQLSETTSGVPWVLLSAGVNFPTYQLQVEIACDAGASGVVAGRAVWKEAFEAADEVSRDRFLKTIAISRARVLADTANYRAKSWMECVAERIPRLEEGWHVDYSQATGLPGNSTA